MTEPIRESGMEFGMYREQELFHIEKSTILADLGEGIKSVEFILKKNENQIWLVEAKKSCPNPDNRDETEEKSEKFERFYSDVPQKFCDSFQIYLASVLNCYRDVSDIGISLRKPENIKKCKLRFVLVIKNAKLDWLAAPKAILEERMLALRKIWDIEIVVLNEELAKQYGLICDT